MRILDDPRLTPAEADELIRWHTLCASVSAQTDDFAGARWHREKLAQWEAWRGGVRGFPDETTREYIARGTVATVIGLRHDLLELMKQGVDHVNEGALHYAIWRNSPEKTTTEPLDLIDEARLLEQEIKG